MNKAQQVSEGPCTPPTGILCHAWQISPVCINVLPQQGNLWTWWASTCMLEVLAKQLVLGRLDNQLQHCKLCVTMVMAFDLAALAQLHSR
jgi:hypothetical protein